MTPFRKLLFNSVLWLTKKFSSEPEPGRVFRELTDLYDCILKETIKKGPLLPLNHNHKFIIFSDQHKGARNGADDFAVAEPNYLAALDYYYENDYFFISLGDSEELWENTLSAVIKNQKPSFDKEKLFIKKKQFLKIFGNHDLYWNNDPLAGFRLKELYDEEIPVYEGVVLRGDGADHPFDIFCTHGHQGDKVSDGNWFSKFFVSKIWAPLQSFTKINPNTPAYDAELKTLHNSLMYEWSSNQENVILITGHTHQPVFESLTHIERMYRKLELAKSNGEQLEIEQIEEEVAKLKFSRTSVPGNYSSLKPSYFNSGCCCFNDGDITGIELENACIRLVKWELKTNISQRLILEEAKLKDLK
jgi:UDP-2,3-diacylglucosamine pyrophosphatase LpxH